jgi:lipoprotein-releasing system permease protein
VPYELQIAWRHVRARGGRSLSVVSWLSILGVALGVAALVGGFAVTSGFEIAFREKVLGVTAHIFVREYGIRFTGHREVDEIMRTVPGVRATSPITYNEALVAGRTGTQGSVIKGIDVPRATAVLALSDYVESGTIDGLGVPDADGVSKVLLGAELARRIGAKTGDVVTLVSPLKNPDPQAWSATAATPTSRMFRVAGIYRAGYYEYDARYAFMDLATAQKFFGLGDVITGFEVAVEDVLASGVVANALRERLGPEDFSVMDWRRQNRNLFTSLVYQRVAIVIVISVMVVLASCLVACILIMIVMERTKEIAILKAMGARERSILAVFVAEGMAIGAVGTALGLVLAAVLFQGFLTSGISLDPKVYGIARLPIVFNAWDYVFAASGALGITFMASLLPAWRGARMAPVEGLVETHG